ncbi:MAG TPA: metallophosphoesterase [Myxococcaceae bacterium]|jgi:hypothetical protein
MPTWARFAIFFTVFLGVIGGGHFFLYRRLVRAVTDNVRLRRIGGWVLTGLFASLVVAMPVARVLQNTFSELVGAVAWTWLGVAWYLSLSAAVLGLLAFAVGRAARKPPEVDASRRRFLTRAAAGGAVAASAGLAGYGLFRAYAPAEVTELVVKLRGLPRALDGFTIAQVTDIHVGPTIGRRFLDDMVARVNALKPDLVAITGDLVDGSVESLGPCVAALRNLSARNGVAFITGNHEYYSGDEEWCAALASTGVQVLRNRRISIGDPAASFDLVGVDDWSAPEERRSDLQAALAGRDPERATVLLAHQPRGFEKAAELGVGLQLSGHTHGGQMFPFNFVVGMTTPYVAGFYRHQGAQLYVSRGTGFWGPPFRVGAPPEIVKVVLQAS